MVYRLTINGEAREVDAAPEMPLLWVLRDILDIKGPKFGCGVAQCGACTVHLDGQAVRSCVIPISAADGMQVTTIEGMSQNEIGRKLQAVWVELDVPQCGYCQAGQIMSAVSLLTANPRPTDADIDAAMAGNACRCGTYARIRAGIKKAAGLPLTDSRDPV